MIDQFHELLQGLGQQLGIPLHPDKRGACKLNIRNLFHVQLECEHAHMRILMASFICEVPPGKVRENIFRDALKANYPYPEEGAFAYCERNNKLSLHLYISLHGLTSDKLLAHLSAFIEKATLWKEQVSLGQTSTLVHSVSNEKAKPFSTKL